MTTKAESLAAVEEMQRVITVLYEQRDAAHRTLQVLAEAARLYLESASSCTAETTYYNPRVEEDEKRLRGLLLLPKKRT